MTADAPAASQPARRRVLHPQLATLLADMRHGEMICISDAGSGTHQKTLLPLDPSVEHINLGVATGVPLVRDLVDVLVEVGEFEGAIVSHFTVQYNPEFHGFIQGHFGPEAVHEVQHFPDWYTLRDRARAHIQTGDAGTAAQVILIAGHPSASMPIDWLKSSQWYEEVIESGGHLDVDETGTYQRVFGTPEKES